jgi:hypothetical protein
MSFLGGSLFSQDELVWAVDNSHIFFLENSGYENHPETVFLYYNIGAS